MPPFELLEDVGSNMGDFVNSAWGITEVGSIAGGHVGPTGLSDASRLTHASSSFPFLIQSLFRTEAGFEKPITFGGWAKVDSGQQNNLRLRIRESVASTQLFTFSLDMTESWTQFRGTQVFSVNFVGSEFTVEIAVPSGGNSGDTFYLANPFVFVDCRYISLDPENNYEKRDEKRQNEHITRTGERYVYKWGDFERTKFGLEFINSREQSLINSWWNNNTNLLWVVDSGNTSISSVQLLNRRLPISKFMTPLLTEFKGVVELGTY